MNRLTVTRAILRFTDRLLERAQALHVNGLYKVLSSKHVAWMNAKHDAAVAEEVAAIAYATSRIAGDEYLTLADAVDAEVGNIYGDEE